MEKQMSVEYWRVGLQKGVCHVSPVAIGSSTQEAMKEHFSQTFGMVWDWSEQLLTHIMMGDKKHITTLKHKKKAIDGVASCEFPSEQEIQSCPFIRSNGNTILEHAGASYVPYAQKHHHRSMW